MTQAFYYTNHFLVAMPCMDDKRFERSVIYICEHGSEGALGITVNRPMEVAFADVLIHLGYLHKNTQEFALNQPVLWGGPCATDRGFVLHRSPDPWKNSFVISDSITLTTSQDILESIGQGNGPSDALIAFGCARWDAGQLEKELADNIWLVVPVNESVIFDCPLAERWASAAHTMGVDFKRMAYDYGHA